MNNKYEILTFEGILDEGEFNRVYRPNDDSYLFLDVLLNEISLIPQDSIILEIG